jgi:hypothetical protein
MRDSLKILPLGLLLPLVIGAASVKPDDAVSNISAWAHQLGFEAVSRWLSNPAADNRVILGSLGVAALYAFLVWTIPAIRERAANPRSERLKTHLYSLSFYSLCIIIVVAAWRFVPGPQPPAKPYSPPITVSPPAPPAPWVSEEEFQAARKVGRLLIPFTPEEISSANYSRGSVTTDAYVGRWVKSIIPLQAFDRSRRKTKKSI